MKPCRINFYRKGQILEAAWGVDLCAEQGGRRVELRNSIISSWGTGPRCLLWGDTILATQDGERLSFDLESGVILAKSARSAP